MLLCCLKNFSKKSFFFSLNIYFQILGDDAPNDARLFFSVERFDYTKGIKEKLLAYKKYFEKYPDRIGKDVLYQVNFFIYSNVL